MTAEEKLEKWEAGKYVLIGVGDGTYSPRVAELAGMVGYDMVWIEIEHGPGDFSVAEHMALATKCGGALPILRIPDHHRHHVLRALEVGARFVVVPMVNDRDTAREIVRWGKYRPLGERGFNTASRGLDYGLRPILENFEHMNKHTHLIAQIETAEAVDNIDAIVNVEGLSGILVGPGDLSADMGCPAEFTNERLGQAVAHCISTAKKAGKHGGILTSHPGLLKTAYDAGSDFVFVLNSVVALRNAMKEKLEETRNSFR